MNDLKINIQSKNIFFRVLGSDGPATELTHKGILTLHSHLLNHDTLELWFGDYKNETWYAQGKAIEISGNSDGDGYFVFRATSDYVNEAGEGINFGS
jgi:hypothetical protein